MLLEDASPSIEVLPSPWQASRVGAMTSIQPGPELTQGCSGFYKVCTTSGFPPCRMVGSPSGVPTDSLGCFLGALFPASSAGMPLSTSLHPGTAEKSVETLNSCLLSFIVSGPMQLRYGGMPPGRKPPSAGLRAACLSSS